MSGEKFISEVKAFLAEHPIDSSRVFVDVDSPELLDAFNTLNAARVTATGRKCKKIAINPHTGEKRCIEWE